jgi:hypothetical protein
MNANAALRAARRRPLLKRLLSFTPCSKRRHSYCGGQKRRDQMVPSQ